LLICNVFVIYRIVDSLDGMDSFMKTFLWSAVLIAGGVVTACVLRPTLVFAGGRFRGFVGNANTMGVIATTMLAPSAWVWLAPAGQFSHRMKLLGTSLMGFWIVCLLLTASRASVLGSLPLLVAVIYLRGKDVRFWMGSLVLGIVIFFFVSAFMMSEARLHLRSLDMEARLAHAVYGFSVAMERPFLGHGYGHSILHVTVPGGELGIHNGYLTLAIDLGFAGLSLVLLLALLALRSARIVSKVQRSFGLYNAGVVLVGALLAGYLLNTTVEAWLVGIGSVQLFMFIILMGVIFSVRASLEDELLLWQFEEDAELYVESESYCEV